MMRFVEKDETGRVRSTFDSDDKEITKVSDFSTLHIGEGGTRSGTVDVLAKVFLPAGFPNSVSPGAYQIYNAIQAFCSSLAGLLSSRALLEGFGVGDANATATNAVLLTVAQDVFSRLTTIIAAYLLGPSLFPDAKIFRFLADVFNDTAIIFDASTPILRASGHANLRVAALCLAGASRAICGTICGGAKAALTLHFATPLHGTGDIGDVNAKDASKETLLALMGMLAGSFVVHHLSSTQATHALLLALLAAHLTVNYLGVRGVCLRTLNRQRAALAWTSFREYGSAPSPAVVANMEGILARPGAIIHAGDGGHIGWCTIGRRLSQVPPNLDMFAHERYVVYFTNPRRVAVALKAGHDGLDHLRGWVHATEALSLQRADPVARDEDVIRRSYEVVKMRFEAFVEDMRREHWRMEAKVMELLSGVPETVIVEAGVEQEKRPL
ncbi:DUF647-domain-containing protein [Schizophyllum commune Tattone D]|nr:DUF647-domain-containing protein [Schizophyllum commune Tattone D]